MPRAPPSDIELFDSQATEARTVPGYLLGEAGNEMNGSPRDWFGRLLLGLKLVRGVTLSFNNSPSQRKTTNTCALQVLARAMSGPDVPPAEFTKRAFDYFS